jgi:hypothetical protein
MGSFLKFGGMTPFLILVLTNYKKWCDDGSTHSIPQTKQKSEEWEDDGLAHSSNQTAYKVYGIAPPYSLTFI